MSAQPGPILAKLREVMAVAEKAREAEWRFRAAVKRMISELGEHRARAFLVEHYQPAAPFDRGAHAVFDDILCEWQAEQPLDEPIYEYRMTINDLRPHLGALNEKLVPLGKSVEAIIEENGEVVDIRIGPAHKWTEKE